MTRPPTKDRATGRAESGKPDAAAAARQRARERAADDDGLPRKAGPPKRGNRT